MYLALYEYNEYNMENTVSIHTAIENADMSFKITDKGTGKSTSKGTSKVTSKGGRNNRRIFRKTASRK